MRTKYSALHKSNLYFLKLQQLYRQHPEVWGSDVHPQPEEDDAQSENETEYEFEEYGENTDEGFLSVEP